MRILSITFACLIFFAVLNSSYASGGTARIPVSVVITSAFHEMKVMDAFDYCQWQDNEYCKLFEDGVISVQEADGFTVFEILDRLVHY